MTDLMMTNLIYRYSDLRLGKLLKRYKRFLADIELDDGEVITAHCPNTGPMTGVCVIGARVGVSYHDDPKRKLAYTWEIIEVDQTWVGINTSLPNRIVKELLNQRLLPELGDYVSFKPEVAYGKEKSRIDFLLTYGTATEITARHYLEVKNTTWTKGSLALFPDTETTRGQKHLRELMGLVSDGTGAAVANHSSILFFINRGDCDSFAPGAEADPEYGRLFAAAKAAGVNILPCRFMVSPEGVAFMGIVPLKEVPKEP